MKKNQDKTMLINLNKHKIVPIVFIATVFYVPFSHSAMYKWVDSEGNTHYTQQPPLGDIEAETIKSVVPNKDTESAQAEINRKKEKADKLRKDRQDKAKDEALRKENEAIQEENCKRSKQQVSTYSRPRGLIEQEDGSRIRIPEEQRQEGLAKAKEMVEKYCKPYY